MTSCLRYYWPEYLIEAAGLRAFMISAFVFTGLLIHPGSPVTLWIADPVWKRAAIGIAMSLTAIGSSTFWGTRSCPSRE
jgi:aquaporin Z